MGRFIKHENEEIKAARAEEEERQNNEKILKIAEQIMNYSRNRIMTALRFMDTALNFLEYVPDFNVSSASTDGRAIYYNPKMLLKLYKRAQEMPARQYLHMVLHCVFKHFYVDPFIDERCWNLACDVAVENMINELVLDSDDNSTDLSCVKLVLKDKDGNIKINMDKEQKELFDDLKERFTYMNAEVLYHNFMSGAVSEDVMQALEEYCTSDNHDIWYKLPEEDKKDEDAEKSDVNNGYTITIVVKGDITPEELKEIWDNIARRMQIEIEEFSKIQGNSAGNMVQNLKAVNREKYDYTDFLKKFAVLGEVMSINADEFDQNFYTYGLKLYGNVPLIEPLEYKDDKRIREFVIAVDTSGSTSGELVQNFIQKTYNILMQEESFFNKVNIHIIQCDADIQEDVKITCREEFENYIKSMQIKGLGGTNFIPVYNYVNELIEKKEFKNLKGMIYFTDGYGTFPEKQPPYRTALIYLDKGDNNPEVPVWAIKLLLKEEEIMR